MPPREEVDRGDRERKPDERLARDGLARRIDPRELLGRGERERNPDDRPERDGLERRMDPREELGRADLARRVGERVVRRAPERRVGDRIDRAVLERTDGARLLDERRNVGRVMRVEEVTCRREPRMMGRAGVARRVGVRFARVEDVMPRLVAPRDARDGTIAE